MGLSIVCLGQMKEREIDAPAQGGLRPRQARASRMDSSALQ